jgi:hexosaminidase
MTTGANALTARQKCSGRALRDVSELHGFIMNELAEHLLAKGKTPVVWNECLKPNLRKEVVIMHWTPSAHELEESYQALLNGYRVIFQTHSESYYDMPHTFNPMKKAYQAKSLAVLTPEMKENTLGTQGALWTEFVPDEERVQFMAFPREAAKAEVAWGGPAPDDYFRFKKRWAALSDHLAGIGLSNHAPLEAVDPNFLTRLLHAARDTAVDMTAEQRRWGR